MVAPTENGHFSGNPPPIPTYELTLKPRPLRPKPSSDDGRISLRRFLESSGISIRTTEYAQIAEEFANKGVGFDKGTFVVDPTTLGENILPLRQYVTEVKAKSRPQRTAEDIAYYQKQILRLIDKRRTNNPPQPITIEEAQIIIFQRSTRLFQNNNLPQEEAIRLAGLALSKALPYIEGREGAFASFNDFLRTGLATIIRNLSIDRHRQNQGKSFPPREKRKQNPPEEHVIFSRVNALLGLAPDADTEEILLKKMARLEFSPFNQTLIIYRFVNGSSWNRISDLLYANHSQQQIQRLKTAYSRLFDRLFPDRIKKPGTRKKKKRVES